MVIRERIPERIHQARVLRALAMQRIERGDRFVHAPGGLERERALVLDAGVPRKVRECRVEEPQRIAGSVVFKEQRGLGQRDIDRRLRFVGGFRVEHREGGIAFALVHQDDGRPAPGEHARPGFDETVVHVERGLPVAVSFGERAEIEKRFRRIVTGAQALAEAPGGFLDVAFAKCEEREPPFRFGPRVVVLQQALEFEMRLFDPVELNQCFRKRESVPLGIDAARGVGRGERTVGILAAREHARKQRLRVRRLRIARDRRFGEHAGIAKHEALERKVAEEHERRRIELARVDRLTQRAVGAVVVAGARRRLRKFRERLARILARESHGIAKRVGRCGVLAETQGDHSGEPGRIGATGRAFAPQRRDLRRDRELLAVERDFERAPDRRLGRVRRSRRLRVLPGGGAAVTAFERHFSDDRGGARIGRCRLFGFGGAGSQRRGGDAENDPSHGPHYSGRRPDPGEFRTRMKDSIRQRLDRSLDRTEEVGRLLADPDIAGRSREFRELSMEYARLEPLAARYRQFLALERELTAVRELATGADPELRSLGEEEARHLEATIAADELALRELLVPKDPHDERNIFLEVRAGTGGDEAAIFAGDLLRMYTRYAERRGWSVELISQSPGEHGGYREVICRIVGKGAYSWFRFEAGTHRVQRVPATEAQGRIHTSACTVAVLPELDDVDDVAVNPADLRIDTFRSSGAGGQHVNKTDSAIRITHLPSGIVVECQDERSQHKNRSRAMALLSARLLAAETEKRNAAEAAARKSQVGSGDRSERIRTYNFPQGRVTDHRVNVTLYRLDDVMDGALGDLIEPLRQEYQAAMLAQEG